LPFEDFFDWFGCFRDGLKRGFHIRNARNLRNQRKKVRNKCNGRAVLLEDEPGGQPVIASKER